VKVKDGSGIGQVAGDASLFLAPVIFIFFTGFFVSSLFLLNFLFFMFHSFMAEVKYFTYI
jgi:hypothetical protein